MKAMAAEKLEQDDRREPDHLAGQKTPYEAPQATFVALDLAERLMACALTEEWNSCRILGPYNRP